MGRGGKGGRRSGLHLAVKAWHRNGSCAARLGGMAMSIWDPGRLQEPRRNCKMDEMAVFAPFKGRKMSKLQEVVRHSKLGVCSLRGFQPSRLCALDSR
jgi:hypothetical protein